MNIDQIRDEVAEMLGHEPTKMDGYWMQRTGAGFVIKPISEIVPTTIDGIAALWPKVWKWLKKQRGDGQVLWVATSGMKGYGQKEVAVVEAANEYADRLRLLHAVLTAERNAK